MKWIVALAALLISALSLYLFRPAPTPPYVETRWLMGTQVTLTIAGSSTDEAKKAAASAFAPMESIDSTMARRAGSKLAKLNDTGEFRSDPALYTVVERGIGWAMRSGGAFDPTVGALVDLWAVETGPHPPPSAAELEKAKARTGWKKVSLTAEDRRLETGGTLLELGGIAKGYAVDLAAETLKNGGVKNFIIDAGGDLTLSGDKNGAPWKIGLQDPRNPAALALILSPVPGSIVTSGDYERYFEWEGKRYSHIIDPATGYPATGVRSATVWAEKAIDADALATAICVLGVEKGLALVRANPPAQALVIDSEGRTLTTEGFAKVAPQAENSRK